MFIWVGIDVDNQLTEIKNKTMNIENKLVFKHSNFTLPLHISLKTPFKISDNMFREVIADIVKIYNDYDTLKKI